ENRAVGTEDLRSTESPHCRRPRRVGSYVLAPCSKGNGGPIVPIVIIQAVVFPHRPQPAQRILAHSLRAPGCEEHIEARAVPFVEAVKPARRNRNMAVRG